MMTDVEKDNEPACDTCGAPITTGAMAVFCPRRERCEFWPDDEEGQRFVSELRGESQR